MVSARISALEAKILTRPDQLSGLAAEWDDLAARSLSASIFQTWEWADAWWRHFGRGRRLLLLIFREEGRLAGLAPFSVKRHLNLPLRKLEFLGTGLTDTLDILIRPDCAEYVLPRLQQSLFDSCRLWDMADFQQLPEESPLADGRILQADAPRMHISLFPQEVCPVVSLPGRWEDFTALLGKKMRYNIGYYERLMRKDFRYEVGMAGEEDLEAEMDAFFSLHRRRWRKRRLPGVLQNISVQRFHHDVARRFLRRGWLRLYYLKLDGVTRASLYCFQRADRAYYYLGGFDPDLGRYSPGTVLTAHALREAVGAGCRYFDFLRGHEAYKYRWEPANRVNNRLLLAKPGLCSAAMLGLNRLERKAEARLKDWIEKWQENR
ncbi:MAG: GNAT family N-acetyltransferase [Armatimonadetes bacterium]|nr:GNAT family N-acetyltransferase [Armatimonadota bacterium]